MSDPNAELIDLLGELRQLLSLPRNDFVWSPWNTSQDAISEIESLIRALTAGDKIVIDHLEVLFAPTGPIQEVSVVSGWDQEFLKLAERFDLAIEDRK